MEGEIESGREELRKTVLNYLRTKYCLQIEAGLTIQEAVQKAAETLPEEVFPLVRNFLSELEAGRFGDGKNNNLSRLLRDAERLISNPKEAR